MAAVLEMVVIDFRVMAGVSLGIGMSPTMVSMSVVGGSVGRMVAVVLGFSAAVMGVESVV